MTPRVQSRFVFPQYSLSLLPTLTTAPQIAEMYQRQALAAGGKKKKGGAGDDDFW
jgi:hypothetical protein